MTTRRLIVMRHAKAETFAATDHARLLTDRGRHDAAEAGAHLARISMVPDYAVVSSAARTVATWEAVAEASGSTAVANVDAALFTGSEHIVLEALQQVPEDAERVLFVGHNPTASYLVHYLDNGEGEPGAVDALLLGYPTAAMTVLEVSVPWAELEAETARVVDFHVGRSDQ